jgi:inner membrane protein
MAAARLFRSRPGRATQLSLLGWSALSLLPDADVVGFQLGIRYADAWGHRGATHSLVFAAGVAALGGLVARARRAKSAAFVFAVVGSHPLLDTLTTGGLGCALLWPFDLTRYFAAWRPIPVAPIGLAFFSSRGLAVALVELILFLPLFAFALWPGSPERDG